MKRKFLHIINSLIRRGYWFNNIFFQDCRKFHTFRQFDTEVVNLGSTSAVCAFDYEGFDLKCANWALSRNPLIGDYSILRNYTSFLKHDGATIILPLCPFSSLAGSYDYLDDRYYSILYPSSIPAYSYIHNVQVENKLNNPILYYPWYAPFLDIWKRIFKESSKIQSEEFMRHDASNRFRSWCHEFSISDFKNPLILKNIDGISDAQELILEMNSFCDDHNYRLVLVIPPVYHTLSDMFTEDAKDILFRHLLDSPQLKEIEIYDYLNSKDFSHDITLFKDSFLLNKIGARKFTLKVLTDLKLI